MECGGDGGGGGGTGVGGGGRSGAGEGGHEASTLLVLRVGGVAGEMAAAAVGMFAACGGGGT